MGLFDWVYAPFVCPHCGYREDNHGWQTKSLFNALESFKVGDVVEISDAYKRVKVIEGEIEIHTVCPECKKFVSCWIKIRDGVVMDEIICESSLDDSI